ncbi:UNVERIFIED_CONTAM: hypothetical protein FKN15_024244 [Acipenser sinensis]
MVFEYFSAFGLPGVSLISWATPLWKVFKQGNFLRFQTNLRAKQGGGSEAETTKSDLTKPSPAQLNT